MIEKAEAALETVLRILDQTGGNEEAQARAIQYFIDKYPKGRIKVLLDVAEAMALYLDEDYQGDVSLAAQKILANGPELTARMRSFFLRMAKQLKEAK